MNLFNLLRGFLGLIPEILILALCIYYLAKKKSVDGILMSIGTFIGVLLTFFYSIVVPFVLYRSGANLYSRLEKIYPITGIIGFLASLTFVVGLFLLIQDNIKCRKNNRNNI